MGFRDINIYSEYQSQNTNVAREFYTPILEQANRYDRAVGFFSSTALISIAQGLLPFVNRNGKIRIIASPRLSAEDMQAIRDGYEQRDVIQNALIKELLEPKDFRESERLRLLANLLAQIGRAHV